MQIPKVLSVKVFYTLSLANHSAKDDSVSCNFNENKAIFEGNLF